MKHALICLTVLLIWWGCKQGTTSPVFLLPNGTATVTDTLVWPVWSARVGFDFDSGKTVSSADTASIWGSVDIVTSSQVDWINQKSAPYLFRPGDTLIVTGFCLISKSSSLQEAVAQFHALSVAPETGYHIMADSVEANQVWAFQTIGGKYAKLLIREVHSRVGPAITDTLATEVTFDWVFQPDGSRQVFNP